MGPSTPPRRRDAVANRERILDHAEQVFARDGFEVSLHQIAKDLGFGIGTVYRHFPSHDDLVVAIYRRIQDEVDEAVVEVETIDDPYDRVVAFIDITVRLAVEHPVGRAAALRVGTRNPEAVRASPAIPIVHAAVVGAQRAGRLRADLQPTDVALVAGMLADLVRIPEPARSISLPRMRALLLDSIAGTTERTDLSGPGISTQTIVDIVHRTATGKDPET